MLFLLLAWFVTGYMVFSHSSYQYFGMDNDTWAGWVVGGPAKLFGILTIWMLLTILGRLKKPWKQYLDYQHEFDELSATIALCEVERAHREDDDPIASKLDDEIDEQGRKRSEVASRIHELLHSHPARLWLSKIALPRLPLVTELCLGLGAAGSLIAHRMGILWISAQYLQEPWEPSAWPLSTQTIANLFLILMALYPLYLVLKSGFAASAQSEDQALLDKKQHQLKFAPDGELKLSSWQVLRTQAEIMVRMKARKENPLLIGAFIAEPRVSGLPPAKVSA